MGCLSGQEVICRNKFESPFDIGILNCSIAPSKLKSNDQLIHKLPMVYFDWEIKSVYMLNKT